MNEEIAKKILNDTTDGYDLIAEKFSQTRNRFWGELEFINKFAKQGNKILDFGCGNGRLLEIIKNRDIDYVGVDVSGELINLAKENLIQVQGFKKVNFLKIESDFKRLPFPADYFGTIYSIAVFHHLPSYKIRLDVAKELYRLTESGGYIVITVWDLWQSGHKKDYRRNIFKNWKDKILQKSELDWNDCWITFTNNQGRTFRRFHHAFTIGSLKRLFKRGGFKVLKCEVIKGNIVLIGRKIM